MLLWPRLATYNCPEDVMWIWEQVFRAVYPSGRVVIVCTAERVPVAGSTTIAAIEGGAAAHLSGRAASPPLRSKTLTTYRSTRFSASSSLRGHGRCRAPRRSADRRRSRPGAQWRAATLGRDC